MASDKVQVEQLKQCYFCVEIFENDKPKPYSQRGRDLKYFKTYHRGKSHLKTVDPCKAKVS